MKDPDRTNQVLLAIAKFIDEQESRDIYPAPVPSLRVIGEAIGIEHVSIIRHHVQKLVDHGYCVQDAGGMAHLTGRGLSKLDELGFKWTMTND